MSQYPSPYSPQPYMPPVDLSYYQPADHLLRPARRAAILQGILGGGLLVCCVGMASIPWLVDAEKFISASGVQLPPMPPGWTLDQILRIGYGIVGGCGSILGIALLVLCFFVRGGRRGPVVTSLVLEGIVAAVLGLNIITGIVQSIGNPAALAGVVMIAALLGVFVLNMMWLFVAARVSTGVSAARQQYAAQFFQYQQQQQAYGQSASVGPYAQQGYGYPPQGYGYGPHAQYPLTAQLPHMPQDTPPPQQSAPAGRSPDSGDASGPPPAL